MQLKKLSPSAPIVNLGDLTLGDFWSWAYSDLLSNGNRSVFAEFIVGTALGATATPRREWDAVDLRYDGKTIEVKASAYTQSWAPPTKPGPIRFDIGKKIGWDAATNTSGTSPARAADCYVFCLHNEREREQAQLRMLDVASWEFYVVATPELERLYRDQKSVQLSRLLAHFAPVNYDRLRATIDAALDLSA